MATFIRSVDGRVQVEIEPGSPATLLPNISAQGLQTQIDALRTEIRTYRGQPVVVTDSTDMEDELTIYLYMGSEEGYNADHWYYYSGTEWVDGGAYVANPVIIDDTLTQSGEAADAKVTGDSLYALANVKSKTTGDANTWETVPYNITASKTYVFYNLSEDATITIRTRMTADGTTVDAPSAIAPSSSVEFTATGEAHFLRIISTKASTPWKIEEKGTAIYDINADIDTLYADKFDIIEYKNERTGTCTNANTFYNFPYKVTNGKTYKCYAVTEGNTMSFRTRLTEDGTNIDSLNAVSYGSPKTFTATGDANYIRVNSYLANGIFKIEETGTVYYDMQQLQPSVPIVNLPSKLYAVTGKELNIYFDNIVENAEKYHYNITCNKGAQMERGFSYTPVDADAGSYTFSLEVLNDKGEVIATKTATLIVSASSAGSGTTKTMILLGDSTVSGTNEQIVNDFDADSMTLTTLGTRGTSPSLHEGRTGWMFQYYYGSSEIGGITNPFYSSDEGHFDASYYFTNSGVSVPNWFFIQLGINDVFLPTDDDALNTKINTMVSQCDAIIASLQSADANMKIGIAVTIPPNQSQDAFGKAYNCGQTRDRYKRNNLIWVQTILSKYDSRESERIYLVPILTNLDTIYNMGLETQPVNARNTTITYQSPIANGGVHPVESGYQQLADVYMAFLKAQ